MSELLQAFILGNAAIVGNVCMLPLYPGLMVLLGRSSSRSRGWLGIAVLAGVLVFTVLVGAVFYLLGAPVSRALPVLLPVLYSVVALAGICLMAGWNPLSRLTFRTRLSARSPVLGAFGYGMMLAPMTLPCTGPLIVSAFVVGGVAGSGALVDGLLYFAAFGLGFGWPLVVLPLLTVPFQRAVTSWLGRHHRVIQVVSGVVLVGIAVLGLVADVLPSL